MKNYPRLHSLSTIGIIHHQENDYLFHPERTDFIGDSASGKSIIADLLQLIFVGSTAFKSATATLKEVRDPDGLVLTTQGRGGNIAYAFLNIETAMEQYIVIGAYLESTDKHTRPFIIQTSSTIENDKLVPMDRPLRATDFKNGDYICDLDELTEIMENKLLVLKTWSKIGSYHRILYSNNILPLNLAANDKILKDYAKIIQSFSRAKTLEIKDSKSILNFLFSQDKGKELYNEYVQIAKELESTISEYGQNRGSIQLLMRKYQKVCSLKRSLDAKNRSEKEHLTYELIYSRTEHKRLANSISVDVKKTLAAYHNLQMLLDAAQKDIEQSHKTKSDIDEKVTTTHQSLFKAQTEKDRLAEAQKLLENLQIEEQSLESFYQEYWENKEQYSALQELKTKLSAKNLQSFFEQSEWQKGVAAGNEYYGMRINEIKSDLERLMLLSKYVDIHNPNSLVRWAMSLNRPLSKIEESLLLHFQILKRTEPEHPTNNERFLPSPDALFSNPKIEDRGDSFWIDLGGVWEYVDYVSEQRFNTQNKEELNKYFEHQTQSIEFQRQQLEKERGKLVNMSTIIGELTNAGRAIEIYQKKETVEKFKEIESLNIDADKIQNYLLCLKRKEAIEHNYDQSQQIYKEALAEQNENKSILEKLPTKVKKTEELLQKIKTEEILLAELTKRFSINQAYDYDLSFYHDAEDKVDTFQTEFDFQKKDIEVIQNIVTNKYTFDKWEFQIYQQEENYRYRYNELPPDENETSQEQVQKLREQYIEDKTKYDKEFDDIVKDFIPNESHRFEGESKDFTDLVAHLLPDIFGHEKIIKEEAISKIDAYLNKINDKNREINSKRIRKIENLLDSVFAAVSEQHNMVRKINHFFKDGKKKISGNYTLNLVHSEPSDFPVAWLSSFRQMALTQFNLFDVTNDMNNQSASVEEKIMQSFRELTHNNNPDITISDILNPNSYMELSLEMQDTKKRVNKGSTGQTYAAIALFCIARLSIVGNKHHENDTGIHFMPIDEAEGLGSNFDMLYEISQKYGYQIITFAINPLGRYDNQYIYILHRNTDVEININYTPIAIHSKNDINDELKETIENEK